MSDDISFQDETDIEIKNLSFNEIILRHIRKISDLTCQELTGSYWEKKPIKTQSGIMFTEVYHMDLREAYCNSIDFLIDIIYPKSDKVLKEYIDINDKDNINILEKIKIKRKIFREINMMFERTDFWKTSNTSNE